MWKFKVLPLYYNIDISMLCMCVNINVYVKNIYITRFENNKNCIFTESLSKTQTGEKFKHLTILIKFLYNAK